MHILHEQLVIILLTFSLELFAAGPAMPILPWEGGGRTVATCCLHVHLRRKYGKVATNGLDVYTKWNIVKQYNTILCTIASGLGREKQSCGG